jgi:hypothetical protein
MKQITFAEMVTKTVNMINEPQTLSEDEQDERDEQEIESWESEYEANKSE